jgi:hypothetical protein
MDVVNPRLDHFVVGLRKKLGSAKNVAKDDWREMAVDAIYDLLTKEMEELRLELSKDDIDVSATISECRDVVAFAFMLADKLEEWA